MDSIYYEYERGREKKEEEKRQKDLLKDVQEIELNEL